MKKFEDYEIGEIIDQFALVIEKRYNLIHLFHAVRRTAKMLEIDRMYDIHRKEWFVRRHAKMIKGEDVVAIGVTVDQFERVLEEDYRYDEDIISLKSDEAGETEPIRTRYLKLRRDRKDLRDERIMRILES